MKYLISFMFCLVSLSSYNQTTNILSKVEFQKLLAERSSSLLNECISYQEVVGISAGIYQDGDVVWSDAAGYMDLEGKKKAEVNMVNRLASISKPMTAIAVLQLMEKGLLELDDPIQKYIPDFPVKEEGTITIKHLLQHSSGIKAYKNKKESFPTKNYAKLRDAVSLFEERALANTPGQGYQYTTYGYVVLGLIIEQASGMSYRDYMKTHIWDVAGMVDTDVEMFGQAYANKANLYFKNKKGEFEKDKQTNLSVKVPGGGIQSTVADILKFADAVLNDKLISPETSQLMITDSGLKQRGNPYGLGWFLYSDAARPSGRIIGHSGSQSGTSTQLFIFLDKKAAVVVLSNTAEAWNDVFALTDRLSDALVRPDDVNKPLKKLTKVSNKVMDCYVGKYQFEGGTKVQLSRKGNAFYGSIDGGDKIRLYPESDKQFFIRNQNIDIVFESSTVKAQSFVFIQNGEEHVAKRK